MKSGFSDTIGKHLSWCPNERNIKTSIPHNGSITVPVDVPMPDVPHPGSNPAEKAGFMDWNMVVAIEIIFGTFGFVGLFFWWPFFVGAVLVAGMANWYFHTVKGVV
jgi:hypothetical protein